MKELLKKILLVDDHEPWRHFAQLILRQQPGLSIIGEASDGFEAIQKAKELQPDLIVLDIGLPKLNGFEVARQIRNLAPTPKILFLSQESSLDVVSDALSLASGYVVKTYAGGELLHAVAMLLDDGQYISSGVGWKAAAALSYNLNELPHGFFRVNMDSPMSIGLPEDQQIQHILCDSYVADCNEVQARMYGLNSPEEWIGTRLSTSVIPDDIKNIELTRQFIRAGYQVLNRKSYELDARGDRKVFLNSMIGIIADGKLIATWGTQCEVMEHETVEVD